MEEQESAGPRFALIEFPVAEKHSFYTEFQMGMTGAHVLSDYMDVNVELDDSRIKLYSFTGVYTHHQCPEEKFRGIRIMLE